MKSRLAKTAISVGVILAVALGGVFGYRALFTKKTAAPTGGYITSKVSRMDLKVSIQGTGLASAAVTKKVMPNNSGEIKNLSVKVGDTVKAGAVLFTVDSDQLRQNLSRAKSNLEKLESQMDNLVNEKEREMLQSSIDEAEEAVKEAEAAIAKMKVKAPMGGVVTAVNSSNGDNVQAGTEVLTIVDMSTMKITVAVDELDISKVENGQKAEVKFDAIEDKTYEGTVESIAIEGKSSNSVTTYDVVVTIGSPEGIRLGMNGNVSITVEKKEAALVIPAEALIERNDKKYVMVSVEDSISPNNDKTQKPGEAANNQSTSGIGRRLRSSGLASAGKLVEIKTGIENESYIEVIEGITEGQQILISIPQSTTNSNINTRRNGIGGFGGLGGGGIIQNMPAGDSPSGNRPSGAPGDQPSGGQR